MTDAIQLGEVVKFAELAWRLYELGWSGDFQADVQYRQFGGDVRHLAESLEGLENVINQARREFQNHGQIFPDATGWFDRRSLVEIIGDHSATLHDCEGLLQDNQSYNATTGPGRNIYWNLFVQPRVQSLRQRILLHNSKIELVLQPFKIDLTLRIHNALARNLEALHQRMQVVHHDVQAISQNLRALMFAFDPALIQPPEGPGETEIHQVEIPDDIKLDLEALFRSHPCHLDGGSLAPPLTDMADAFVRFFEHSTRLFDAPFEAAGINGDPPEGQYLNLLVCQFLMAKMLESDEYVDSSELSHWPSYVENLQKQLSDECLRFAQHMMVPHISAKTRIPPIWPEEIPLEYIDFVNSERLPSPMELLLDMELATETERRWRKMTLYRLSESQDKRFRLVITAGDLGQPAFQTMSVNIDMSMATLVPQHATPDGTQPLALLLDDGRDHMHRLVFREKRDLYLFQQALTGYEVVDNYMRHQLQVIFVMRGGRRVMETASLQLWRPKRLEGDRIITDFSDSGSSRGNAPERSRPVNTPDLEPRMGMMPSNSTSTNHVRSGARRSSNAGQGQTNGLGGTNYSNAQVDQPPTGNNTLPGRTPSQTNHTASCTLNGQRGPPLTTTFTNPRRTPSISLVTAYANAQNGQPSAPNGQPPPRRTPSSSAGPAPGASPSTSSQPLSRNSRAGTTNGPSIPPRTTSRASRQTNGDTFGVSPTTTNPRHSPKSYSGATTPRSPLPPLHEETTTSNITSTTSPTFSLRSPFSFPFSPSPSPSTSSPRRSSNRLATPSILSTASHTSQRTVTTIGGAATAPTGTLHTRPSPPLLVLFTQTKPPLQSQSQSQTRPARLISPRSQIGTNANTSANNTNTSANMNIVAITLDSPTFIDYTVCNCASSPLTCQVACLQRQPNTDLTVRRVPRMDILSISSSASASASQVRGPLMQEGVIRISICFGQMGETDMDRVAEWAGLRREFSGTPCRCGKRTEGELTACLVRGHGGKLGMVKEMHRRADVQWMKMRFGNLRDVVGVGE